MGCISIVVGLVTFIVAGMVWNDGGIAFVIAALLALIVYTISRIPSRSSMRDSASSSPLFGNPSPLTFRDLESPPPRDPPQTDLRDVNDAFTGEPIDTHVTVYQCTKCKVYYHRTSLDFLKAETGGKCVSCQSKDIQPIALSGSPSLGRNYTAGVVTLADYRAYVDQVVTFEGVVVKAYYTRYGHNLALMFEDLPLR